MEYCARCHKFTCRYIIEKKLCKHGGKWISSCVGCTPIQFNHANANANSTYANSTYTIDNQTNQKVNAF